AAGERAVGGSGLYADLLKSWCDGLLAHQVTAIKDPALHGGLLCPSCGIIHGRCGDAVYPLLCVAHRTGEAKYLESALRVHAWSERQVSRADGSWVNDVTLSSWKGITVFHAIALAEALEHHGSVLDAATRQQWTDRLARAARFLDGFITIETGNINYPITASACFALCGKVLGDSHYTERGRRLAHEALEFVTKNGFVFGEGHPLRESSPKGFRPVDLGYNVEESLPSLALYSVLTNDEVVREKTVAALRTHMEFMLPDGGWDNSWGTRNYKWTWWGSRTSDGCHPAYVLMAEYEPRFREVARRNLELMARCTHEGLLYGGPDYFAHGDEPCVHHTFTHAKALATVLDRGKDFEGGARLTLPRDEAYGLKNFPEIGTRLGAIGDWRATVTEYDWEYVEHVQAVAGSSGGGHASGGALSLLYHRTLGPVLVASMTEYQMIEISNQQAFGDYPHMTLTPRIEFVSDKTYTSLSDFKAEVIARNEASEIVFDARGQMLTAGHEPPRNGEVGYHLSYRMSEAEVVISASVSQGATAPVRLIVPVVARSDEQLEVTSAAEVRITKQRGRLRVRAEGAEGFDDVPKERTFNLVPGFECVPLALTMQAGREVRVRIVAAKG
ncbi:MAG TPA: hypothetical protein VF214_00125, partial [Edaphobacter sp.]